MPSDEELLSAFARGERSALAALASRYEQPLLNLAVAILGSPDLAVDAVQESWLRVIRYAGSFNGRSGVKTWLYRIVINQCRSSLAARLPPGGDAGERPEGSLDPAVEAAAQDEAERLKRAVQQLPPPLRETVLLCYTQGLTHSEAAEAMGVPVGTVKSRIHAALEQLRSRIKP